MCANFNNGTCKHDQIFPIQVYSSFVYLLIPVATGLCNLTGNSMGMFKIMILMNLLRYPIGDATALIQAVVIGAALPNFISIIREKHPKRKTSLVNFNLVLIFIPCCLYGSTIGSLVQSILPQFIQDLLIFLMFTFFSLTFIKKIRKQLKPNQQDQKRDSLITTQERRQSLQISDQLIKNQGTRQTIQISDQLIKTQQTLAVQKSKDETSSKKLKKQKKLRKKKLKDPRLIRLKKQIKQYEQSMHLKDILKSILIFLVFEILAFFAQGKMPFLQFSRCSIFYPIGLVILTGVTLMYIFLVKTQMTQKFYLYKQVKFKVDINLGDSTTFWKLVAGGLGAGFVQGTVGVGAGTFLMLIMLTFPSLDTRVAAATSGYQILFTGSGALAEQFINDKITLQDAGFFFVWTVVSGGITTFLLYRIIKKMDQTKVKKIFLIIIAVLCTLSLLLIFPISIQRIIQEGWSYMFEATFKC